MKTHLWLIEDLSANLELEGYLTDVANEVDDVEKFMSDCGMKIIKIVTEKEWEGDTPANDRFKIVEAMRGDKTYTAVSDTDEWIVLANSYDEIHEFFQK